MHTDHTRLEWLQTNWFDNGDKVDRWALKLQGFAFDVVTSPMKRMYSLTGVAVCVGCRSWSVCHLSCKLLSYTLVGLGAHHSVPCVMCDHLGDHKRWQRIGWGSDVIVSIAVLSSRH